MKITGTLIKNFLHCPRQAYLYYYGLNFKSDLTKIGELMHKEQNSKEYIFEKIKVDDIQGDQLIEYKKTSSNLEGTKFQVLYYLDFFESKGLHLTGLVKDLTYKQEHFIKLDDETRLQLKSVLDSLQKMLKGILPEKLKLKKNCKKCSFFDYCWVE